MNEQHQEAWNKMMEDIKKVPEHEPLESLEDKVNGKINKAIDTFEYNSDHPVGTCSKCGEEKEHYNKVAMDMIYRENQNLNAIILKILDARTRGQALIPNDIYESIVEHLNLYTE